MFKKVYSLYSAFCTQPAFYTQSAVYPWSAVCSLQSAVRSLRFTLTENFVKRTAYLQTEPYSDPKES